MSRRPARDELVAALFVAALSAALLAFAYVGLFTRYMADDYCAAVAVRRDGFLGSQLGWYGGWTGRFSFSFVLAAAESVGPAVEVLATVPARTLTGADAGAAAGRAVAVRQGPVIATAFHPELTGDLRVHGLFCDLVKTTTR